MKITVTNIVDQYPNIKVSLPKQLNKDEFSFIKENIDLYNDDDDITKYIDTFVLKLNQAIDKKTVVKEKKEPRKKVVTKREKTVTQKPKSEPKVRKTVTKSRAAAQPKKRVKANDIEVQAQRIEKRITLLSNENRVVNSYYLMNGKQKTKKQLQNFLTKVDRLKDAKNPGIISRIYQQMQKAIKALKDNDIAEIEIPDKTITEYKEHVRKNKSRLTLKVEQLNGLRGISGVPFNINTEIKQGKVMSSNDLAGHLFSSIEFTGKWKELIGEPGIPFKIMIYGGPGSGKSTLSISFAKYLAANHNQKVLYVAKEEGFSQTLKEKLVRLKAFHPNLFFIDELPSDLSPYDVIFFDSVSEMRIEPEVFEKIKTKYPNKSFVLILQVRKDGKFRGSQEWEHLVDAVIKVESMYAQSEKNRYGGKGKVSVL